MYGGQLPDDTFLSKPIVGKLLLMSGAPARRHQQLRGLVHSDHLYIFGGECSEGHLNDMWNFNLGTNVWTKVKLLGNIPNPRSAYKSAAWRDYIIIFGGFCKVTGRDTKYYNYIFFFFFHTGERGWEQVLNDQATPPATHITCFFVDPQTSIAFLHGPGLWRLLLQPIPKQCDPGRFQK